MLIGRFDLSKYQEPSSIICDLCDKNKTLVQLFIGKHTTYLCPDCYNEIRNQFIKCK